MAELEEHLTKLLAGDVVPVGNIAISHKPGGKVAGILYSLSVCL